MTESEPIKCVIVGDGAVGKTSILISYGSETFPSDYVPTIVDNYTTEVQVNGATQILELWDTAGQEEYDQLRPLSYPGTMFLLYIISSRSSFESVTKWYAELASFWKDSRRPVPIVLVGNKFDLTTDSLVLEKLAENNETLVSPVESEVMAKRIGALDTIQCSAKTKYNLKHLFDVAVNCVLQYRQSSSGSCNLI